MNFKVFIIKVNKLTINNNLRINDSVKLFYIFSA